MRNVMHHCNTTTLRSLEVWKSGSLEVNTCRLPDFQTSRLLRLLRLLTATCLALTLLSVSVSFADATIYPSHPPLRPLPMAADRPLAEGPAFFVDAGKGDDGDAGTKDK